MNQPIVPEHGSSTESGGIGAPLPGGRRTRVLIDGFFIDRSYGFGRYVRELLHALESVTAWVQVIVVVPPRGVDALRAQAPSASVVVRTERFFPVWEQWVVPAVARESAAEVVHFPYQTSSLFWPQACGVMTLHDLIPLSTATKGEPLIDRFAHYYRRWLLRYWSYRTARIISVSDATRSGLLALLGRDSVVIPNAVDSFVTRHADEPAEQSKVPYLLHRGGVTLHKNTARIIGAFASVREARPNLRLRIFGIQPDDDFASEHAAPGVEFLGFVEEARLAALYKGATAVVTASLQEGFGLTLIEAFAFGAPLITSDRLPMAQIAGDAALLVDPESVPEMARAMTRIVSDPALAETLRRAGRERARAYSSTGFGERLARLYAEVADAGCASRSRMRTRAARG